MQVILTRNNEESYSGRRWGILPTALLLGCTLLFSPSELMADTALNDLELVSVAQDLFRQQDRDVPRGALEIRYIEGWGRVFYVKVVGRRTTIMDDVLSAFLVGGALSQHARTSLDHVVVIGVMEFKEAEDLVLSSPGNCCEQLYNNRITTDQFSDNCLVME